MLCLDEHVKDQAEITTELITAEHFMLTAKSAAAAAAAVVSATKMRTTIFSPLLATTARRITAAEVCKVQPECILLQL